MGGGEITGSGGASIPRGVVGEGRIFDEGGTSSNIEVHRPALRTKRVSPIGDLNFSKMLLRRVEMPLLRSGVPHGVKNVLINTRLGFEEKNPRGGSDQN